MKFVNDLYLLVNVENILRSIVFRDLDVDIPLDNETTAMLKLEQLSIDTVEENLEEYCADYRPYHYQDDNWDNQSVDIVLKRYSF